MPRIATKFDDHKIFGTFTQPEVSHDSLTPEVSTVVASDKDSKRSGEVTVTTYALSDSAENPMDAALALFGGSDTELAKFAITARNESIRADAKRFIVDSIIGPEKKLAQTIRRVAKALGLDEAAVDAKVRQNPAYLEMLTALAKG
jgi:ribosomal protein L30/L7E